MRLKHSVVLAFIAAIVGVSPVLAAAYSAPYTITETSSTAYTMLPVSVDVGNQWLADNGFMESDALDTRVETLGGLKRPHMVAGDRTLTAVAVPADSQNNLYFTTGNTDLTAVDIIAGYDGYLTIPDAAGLEPANDFEIEIDGYVDTSSGSDKNLVLKDGAFRTYVSASGSVSAAIIGYTDAGWTSPTGFVDPGSNWTNEANVYDESTSSYATYTDVPAGAWSTYLELTHTAIWSDSLRFYARYNASNMNSIDLDAYYSGAWYDVYEGVYANSAWVEKSLGGNYSVTAARARFYNTSGGPYTHRFYEMDFGEVSQVESASVTATGVSSGEHTVKVTADTTDLKIYIDDVEEDSVALSGASVPDNANDWIIGQNNVLPYMVFYKHTVSSSLITRYEPNAIIINTGEAGTADAGTDTTLDDAILTQANDYWNGARLIIVTTTDTFAPQGESAVITDFDAANDRLTFAALTAVVGAGDTYTVDFGTMPDREAASNDARITWGVNPTGVVVVLGGMVSDAQPSPGLVVEDETTDILPAVGVSDWFEEPDVSGTLLANPLRPMVTLMSDTTSITELQAWRLLALAFILFVAVSALVAVKGHLLITGIAAGAAIGLAVAWTIYPLWALVFVVMAVVGGLVSERSPSL